MHQTTAARGRTHARHARSRVVTSLPQHVTKADVPGMRTRDAQPHETDHTKGMQMQREMPLELRPRHPETASAPNLTVSNLKVVTENR